MRNGGHELCESVSNLPGALLWSEMPIDSVPVDASQNRDHRLPSLLVDEFTKIPRRFPHVNIFIGAFLVASPENVFQGASGQIVFVANESDGLGIESRIV